MTDIIPILLFHISSAPDAGRFGVAPSEFSSHLPAIIGSERSSLSLTEVAAFLRHEWTSPPRPFAVTFDDASSETLDAVAELAGRGLRASVYVTTGQIGKRGMLSRRGVAELSRLPGVELGAHAVIHRRLDELGPVELTREVRASKAALEDVIQGPVRSFSYPHGAYDARVREAVVDAGYLSAAAVKNAVSHMDDDPFALARWTVCRDTRGARVAEVLDGVGVPLAWRRERERTRAYRAVRRARRRLVGEGTETSVSS
jgi:peptidoglycan/xylan/chitin deacetylase (PgdA/CDA1 family)